MLYSAMQLEGNMKEKPIKPDNDKSGQKQIMRESAEYFKRKKEEKKK